MKVAEAIEQMLRQFAIAGRVVDTQPFSGHINDSYIAACLEREGTRRRYLLQRVNDRVFPRPIEVMENIERITRHIAAKAAAAGMTDTRRRALSLVPALDGRCFYQDPGGGIWRVYSFIEGSRSYSAVSTPEQAETAGRAFGEFQRMLADYSGPRLHETIAGFHHTPARYAALDAVIGGSGHPTTSQPFKTYQTDAGRAKSADLERRIVTARGEIESAEKHRPLANALNGLHEAGLIPERIVHNDAKISNVLLDETTGEALCVVDLDTVMPGLSLYDFGDMVRSMTTTAAEDEPDLSKVEVELPLFEALTRGYLTAAGDMLNEVERERLVTAGKLITLEQAVRFLTDYLAGDAYYKTTRPGQNLDRAKSQFKLLESLEQYEPTLGQIARGF